MLGIPVAIAASNATEWFVHRYVLHGLGRHRTSMWSFHWHEHHRNARRHDHVDPDYRRSVFGWHGQGKEALALVATGAALAPLLPLAPFFVVTSWACGVEYYVKHRRAHLDPDWAREHLPWHWDHHMGPNQDANWCVTRPWFDHLMGTREPWAGTAKEAAAAARRAARRAARGAAQAAPA